MKTLLIVLIALLLSGCAGLGSISETLFGANTTSTIETCTAEGVCMEIEIDGELSASEMLAIAAQVAAAKEAANETDKSE